MVLRLKEFGRYIGTRNRGLEVRLQCKNILDQLGPREKRRRSK